MPVSPPGFANQPGTRNALRVLGLLGLATALALLVIAGRDFFTAFSGDGQPKRFWLFFVALPLLAVSGWLLQAGFLGAGARYAAGEVAPVARDTMGYLRTDPTGDTCAACGTRNDAGSTYCDNCGQPLRRGCAACDAANDADAKYCASCGKPLNA